MFSCHCKSCRCCSLCISSISSCSLHSAQPSSSPSYSRHEGHSPSFSSWQFHPPCPQLMHCCSISLVFLVVNTAFRACIRVLSCTVTSIQCDGLYLHPGRQPGQEAG